MLESLKATKEVAKIKLHFDHHESELAAGYTAGGGVAETLQTWTEQKRRLMLGVVIKK